jgi:hypothetical protein
MSILKNAVLAESNSTKALSPKRGQSSTSTLKSLPLGGPYSQDERELLEDKINQCRGDMHESHNPVYNDSLVVEIQALEWIQGQIQDLMNKETKKR